MVTPQIENYHILTLSCPSQPGIVAAVSGFMARHRCFIMEMHQFDDVDTRQFFMRILFRTDPGDHGRGAEVCDAFREIAEELNITWEVHDTTAVPRVIIMASREEHCLLDLLHRYRSGELHVNVAAVVSNHPDLESLVRWFRVPYVHLPVSDDDRERQEDRLMGLIEETGTELLVLARYMQVLSPRVCEHLTGRLINIHHSFLPSFSGARPYAQAHQRGVKLIGATAHYVTPELDGGPIIEQTIERVDHTYSTRDLVAAGRDTEKLALARAVKLHIERRVFINANRTVVFR